MPRANRHYIPGHIWHLTHRCHKKEFLLKFGRDRRRWLAWLYEARKRYGLSVLNYIVTSNHIHLVARDNGGRDTIPKSIQLIAGRTGQEYNKRKNRKGAFWEDRYHATAVERGDHLVQCMVYVDMNMVRTGAVDHPSEWVFSGFNDIRNPRMRYTVIDYQGLMNLLGFESMEAMIEARCQWIEEALVKKEKNRESKWTESIAVGSKGFVERTKEFLGIKVKGRKVMKRTEGYELREPAGPYNRHFDPKNVVLRPENTYFWRD